MINQDRVRQMSRLAKMETEVGKRVLKVCSYKKIDYVVVQLVKGFIMGTVCFCALLFLWLCFVWDDLNLLFADAQFVHFIKMVLERYVVFIIIYLVICALVAGNVYKRCNKKMKLYSRNLNLLHKYYVAEDGWDDED